MAPGDVKKKVLPQRVTGKVSEWKGKFGWVMPSSPINHPEASKRGGKLYLSQEDVEQELSGIGCQVSFFVYADKSGLGAMNVVPSTGKQQPAKWGSAGAEVQKGSAGGAKAGGAKGGGRKGGGPAARTKVCPQRLSGTVSEWKNNFGWIIPSEKIDHPRAGRRGGKLYVAQEDIELDLSGVGAKVSFFLYEDASGLGAMNVRPGGVGKAEKRPMPGGNANGTASKKQQKTKEDKPQVAPDKTARTPVTSTLVSGKVASAKGKVAWIIPSEPIEHELATKSGGRLYLHADDLETDEFPLAGAEVIFFVYEDEKGLGAEHCQVTEQGDGTEVLREPREKKLPEEKSGVKASKLIHNTALKSKVAMKGGGKATKDKKPKGKGKGNDEEKEKGPSGPDLDRERITLTPITGEVLHWNEKKSFGWIKPTEPLDNPDDASKEVSKLYFHQKDVVDGTNVEKGSMVSFQVYKDACNLGAEEVS